jgi:hypothetical protein
MAVKQIVHQSREHGLAALAGFAGRALLVGELMKQRTSYVYPCIPLMTVPTTSGDEVITRPDDRRAVTPNRPFLTEPVGL